MIDVQSGGENIVTSVMCVERSPSFCCVVTQRIQRTRREGARNSNVSLYRVSLMLVSHLV